MCVAEFVVRVVPTGAPLLSTQTGAGKAKAKPAARPKAAAKPKPAAAKKSKK